jgi:radical SAM protein with 4Fe4S-binding SPASM domain
MDLPGSTAALQRFAAGQRELGRLFVARVREARGPGQIPQLRAWRPLLRRLQQGVPARPREGPLAPCGVGRELAALDVQGRFSPCHRFVFYDRDRAGSFDMGALEGGIDADPAAPLAELTVADQRDEAGTRCVDCDLFDLCAYGCPAISWAATGSLTTVPRAACAVMRAQARACGEVHDALQGDPRYLGWLGQPLQTTLRATATSVAQEAWRQLQEPE